jgi:lipopolysaccharide/colanic/teichoic acid biosynthesis glycosyltransferase
MGETAVESTTPNEQYGRDAGQMQYPTSPYFTLKSWPTRLIGGILLILASPGILLLVAIVRVASPGPGLYRQTRTGRHGREFQMYKIRTMYQDAESVSGPKWCTPGDSRITPLGRILRLLHLDELPQLINVVRGEMDLIGPRPERPAFVDWLSKEIPGYKERLQVLPGVTGLAQINLPPDVTINCVRKKLVLDCQYISDASLSMDIRILACTFLRMLGIRQGRAARWLGVRRYVAISPATPRHDASLAGFGRTPSREATRPERAHAHVLNGHHAAKFQFVARTIDEEDQFVADEELALASTESRSRPR